MTKRAFRSMLFLAAIALPGTAGQAQDARTIQPVEPSFAASFAAHAALPTEPEPGPHAVDLDSFEPPVEPVPATRPLQGGVASYYGRRFHGRPTASGERFDMHALTAAHRTLPFGTLVQVTNPRSGASVVVRINDRGPFSHSREIDLSRAAAERIGLINRGHGTVELALLD